MQFYSFIALLASVAAVSAVPTAGHHEYKKPSDPSKGSTNTGEICPTHKQQVCCKNGESGILGNVLGGACELNVLGQNCAGNIQCCQVDSSGSLLAGSCAPAVSL